MDGVYLRTSKRCKTCGQEFRVKPSHYDKKVYCSVECMRVDYRVRMVGEKNAHYSNADERFCDRCGAAYRSYDKRAHYCSRACFYASRRTRPPKQATLPLSSVTAKQLPSPDRICASCGSEFHSVRAARYCSECRFIEVRCVVCDAAFRTPRYNVKKTCSVACNTKSRSLRQVGEKSHRWRGGKTSEALIFRNTTEYKAWRRAVFERDDYACQMCGGRGVRLSAHHITRFQLRRDLALEIWNGISLCRPCHTSIRHHETEYEERFYSITGGGN